MKAPHKQSVLAAALFSALAISSTANLSLGAITEPRGGHPSPGAREEQQRRKNVKTTALFFAALLAGALAATSVRAADVTPAEARAIAKEAYIYGFPMVDGYRILHTYFVNSKGDAFKAPWNQLYNTSRVYTPADTTVQTPNSDTPYSFI